MIAEDARGRQRHPQPLGVLIESDQSSGVSAPIAPETAWDCRIPLADPRNTAVMRRNGTQLDALDREILRLLQEDATVSPRDLAGMCHSSEATVRRRIARLRHNDVMRIVAVADPFKQGYSVVAIINMKIDQRKIHDIKTALARMKELRFVGVTVGGYDMVAEAWFKSTAEMLTFTTDALARVPGILRTEPLQILEMVTYTYDWGKRV
jgi:Lrp/AsnC family transcriptional regulator, regulator for asnA, asnC and gidA